MIPIRDENRSHTTPHITRILIIINLVMFIPILYVTLFSNRTTMCIFAESLFENFTMTPIDILQGRNLHTLLTSMFLHADIFHIGGNLLFLHIFGDNVEDALGHIRYLIFYLVCGLAADLTHIISLTSPMDLTIPTLGASGAISGILGAYIIMYPKAKILALIFIRLIWIIPIPAVIFIGVWFAMQLLYTSFNMAGGVAYWAHIGGFILGVILIYISKKTRFKAKQRGYYISE